VLDLAALLDHEQLLAQLERARSLGFLGPGPVRAHVEHSSGFLAALDTVGGPGAVIDLGSGGGVPGLIIGVARPDLAMVLLDATASRCRFLEDAVGQLGLTATVVEGRAEVLGRGSLRGSAVAVVARSFGPPAATAECAAPLLALGGTLVVSEPPDPAADRWPADRLAALGLAPLHRSAASPVVQVLRQVEPCPDAYPRRDGLPAKRPLF
jgi:16S rRNA (guanine527-N7)-methyltransferase